MIVVKKSKRKNTVILLSVLGALVLLLLCAIYLISSGGGGDDPADTPRYEKLAWEGNDGYAYPSVSSAQMQDILIKDGREGRENESFGLSYVEDDGGTTGYFILYRLLADGTSRVYYPMIAAENASFTYSTLYAADSFGYGSVPRIYYLFAVLGSPSFVERVELPSDPAEKQADLASFGLDANTVTVTFKYEETAGGEVKTHTLLIGSKLITGSGYYFMLDDHPYVYASATDTLSMTMSGIAYYVSPNIITPALSQDGTYEPYLTPAYKQWKDTVVTDRETPVSSDAELTAKLLVTKADGDGVTTETQTRVFALSKLTADGYKYLRAALVGKTLDEIEGANFSILSRKTPLDLSAGDKTVSYQITAISGVIRGEAESRTPGETVGAADYVLVTYTADGGDESQAFLALTDPLPATAKTALQSATVGTLSTPISFDVTYTAQNAPAETFSTRLTEIVSISSSLGTSQKEVGDASTVIYKYVLLHEGEVYGEETTAMVNFNGATDADVLDFYDRIRGKKVSHGMSLDLGETNLYYELFFNFISYRVEQATSFVTQEEIVSFRFLNASERDPYYGGELYQNETGRYKLYGVNGATCDNVVKYLGGVGSDSSTATGLTGTSTVAVAMDESEFAQLLEKYIYAYGDSYRIYYELPRGIYDRNELLKATMTEEELDALSAPELEALEKEDYGWLSTIGHTVYVTQALAGGIRYVASDLYGTVCTVPADDFSFVDYDFLELWARKDVAGVDVASITRLDVKVNFDEFFGEYDLKLTHTPWYITTDGYIYLVNPADKTVSSIYDNITIQIQTKGDLSDTKAARLIAGKSEISLGADVYDGATGYATYGLDGTEHFKDFLLVFYTLYYLDELSEEEQQDALENAPLLMAIDLSLEGEVYAYTYEFYRVSDRQVMVRLYRSLDGVQKGASVQNFYITSSAFKKLAGSFRSLMNGETVLTTEGY